MAEPVSVRDDTTSIAASESVLVRLRAALPGFTGALRRVAEQVLADPSGAARATIVELANRSGTSPATVTRFCRAVGYAGYSDLRLGIAMETARASALAGWEIDIGREVLPTDSLERVRGLIVAANVRAIQDTTSQLDLAAVDRTATAIVAARRVDVYGIGGSAFVAAELQLCLHRIGVPIWSWTEVHNGLSSAALLGPTDVALAVSHSGQTAETIEMLAEAAGHGATTVAVTNFADSPLAEVADVVLTTEAYETTFRPHALAARHSQLLVLDLVYVVVAQRTYERTSKALALTASAVDSHRAGDLTLSAQQRRSARQPVPSRLAQPEDA